MRTRGKGTFAASQGRKMELCKFVTLNLRRRMASDGVRGAQTTGWLGQQSGGGM